MNRGMISIRQLQVGDWLLFKRLRLKALQSDNAVFGANYNDEVQKNDAYWQEILTNPDNAIFALLDGDKPIGLTAISYNCDDPDRASAMMWASWLEREYRSRGLSKYFYEARLKWAEDKGDIERVYVGHREGNLSSRNANQKFGFAYTHNEPWIWPDGKTADNIKYIRIIKSPWGQFPIKTQRLILRPPVIQDAEVLGEAKRETWIQLQKWMAWAKGEVDLEEDRKMLGEQHEEFRKGEDCMLTGFEKLSGRPVVFTGLHRPDWEKHIFEIGYWVRSSAQGLGYAQEVTRTLTAHAFNELNASKVVISCADGNKASEAVIKKCGFKYTHSFPREQDQLGKETHWFEKLRS